MHTGGGGGRRDVVILVLSRFAVHELTNFGHQPFSISYITYTYDQSMEYFCYHSIIGTLDATIVCNELPPSIDKHR